MKRWRTAGVVLLACSALFLVTSRSSGGQLGGLIRRAIPDSAKKAGGDKPDDAKKPEPSQPAAAPAARTAGDPDVIPITDDVLTGLEKGLQTEIDLREKLTAEVAANEKGRVDYDACKQRIPLMPQAQEIVMRIANVPSNATAEDLQKLIERNGKDMDALILKTCGTQPQRIDVGRRLTAIQWQGSEATGIRPRGAR